MSYREASQSTIETRDMTDLHVCVRARTTGPCLTEPVRLATTPVRSLYVKAIESVRTACHSLRKQEELLRLPSRATCCERSFWFGPSGSWLLLRRTRPQQFPHVETTCRALMALIGTRLGNRQQGCEASLVLRHLRMGSQGSECRTLFLGFGSTFDP